MLKSVTVPALAGGISSRCARWCQKPKVHLSLESSRAGFSAVGRKGEKMKTAGVVVGSVVLALVAVLGLGWIAQGNDFFMFKVFAPKYEQVRRDTFEQSRAFNQGMVQELQNMQFEYVRAKPEQRDALASIILHRASGYNLDDPIVPNDLRAFIAELRRERMQAR